MTIGSKVIVYDNLLCLKTKQPLFEGVYRGEVVIGLITCCHIELADGTFRAVIPEHCYFVEGT